MTVVVLINNGDSESRPPLSGHTTFRYTESVMSDKKPFFKDIASNKKAYFNYFVHDKLEVGICLTGPELKSIRGARVSLQESYARIIKGELWLIGCHITPYNQTTQYVQDPTRDRKLLAHRHELNRLMGRVNEKGFTIVPLRLYFKNQRVKLEIGVCKSKKLHDKRHVLKEKAMKRDLDRRG